MPRDLILTDLLQQRRGAATSRADRRLDTDTCGETPEVITFAEARLTDEVLASAREYLSYRAAGHRRRIRRAARFFDVRRCHRRRCETGTGGTAGLGRLRRGRVVWVEAAAGQTSAQ